jgi:hypothetical protein
MYIFPPALDGKPEPENESTLITTRSLKICSFGYACELKGREVEF